MKWFDYAILCCVALAWCVGVAWYEMGSQEMSRVQDRGIMDGE